MSYSIKQVMTAIRGVSAESLEAAMACISLERVVTSDGQQTKL